MMRSYGTPEAAILESLTKEMLLRVNTRGGPRDKNEAVVHAALLLLSYPPDGTAAGGKPAATATARNPAPRSVAGVAAPAAPQPRRSPRPQ